MAKYDNAGTFQWVKTFGVVSKSIYCYNITTDNNGNIITSGDFNAPFDFGGTTLTPVGSRSLFFVKYDPSGTLIWANQFDGPILNGSQINISAAKVDAAGNIYTTGSFGRSITYGGNTFTASGQKDIFVAQFQGNGQLKWFRKAGDASNASLNLNGTGISLNSIGEVFISGSFANVANFVTARKSAEILANGPVTSTGFTDAFIMKITNTNTLPLNLISFTGKNENDQNILNWLTANEVALSHFEIERSPLAPSGGTAAHKFKKIGEIKAIGGPSDKVSYEFIDQQASSPSGGGGGFYRLKMI